MSQKKVIVGALASLHLLVFLIAGCGPVGSAEPAMPFPGSTATPTQAVPGPPTISAQEPSGCMVGSTISIPIRITDVDGDAVQVRVDQLLGLGDRYTGDDYVTSQPLEQLDYEENTLRALAGTPGKYRVAVTAGDDDGQTVLEIDIRIAWPPGENPFAIRGIAIDTWGPPEWNDLGSVPAVIDLAAEIGANYLEISPYWNADSISGSLIQPCTDLPPSERGCTTPSDAQLRSWVRHAHARGMGVFLKPHLIVGSFNGGYEGESWQIQPADLAAWFASYTDFILHYAQISQDESVEIFSVGNELTGVQEMTSSWHAVIEAVRGVYDGELTYSDTVLWQPWPDHSALWDRLDYIGLPFYYNGSADDGTASIADMAEAIRAVQAGNLAQMMSQFPVPVIATEMGRPNFDGTNYDPWNWSDRRVDNQELVDYMEAGFQTQLGLLPRFAGLFVWKLSPTLQPADMSWDFRAGPLRDALEVWFAD